MIEIEQRSMSPEAGAKPWPYAFGMPYPVECARHGTTEACFVCQHLANRTGQGFFVADDQECERPHAWCAACDEVLVRVGGKWDDDTERFAGVTMICSGCYDEIRSTRASAGR